jgi:hypothetical protein
MQQKYNDDGSFCLAWFAPSGIHPITVSLDNDDSGANDDPEEDFCENGVPNGEAPQKRRGRKANTGSVTCCSEWRGCRHATEVLFPFGYSAHFIRVSAHHRSILEYILILCILPRLNPMNGKNRVFWMYHLLAM